LLVCEQFAGAKANLRSYTRSRRKEVGGHIREVAMNILLEQPARTQARAEIYHVSHMAEWRQAVEP